MSFTEKPLPPTTHSDFVTAALSATANAETLVGTINVRAGATIKLITYAVRAVKGTLYALRLDYTGIKTPQKYVIPSTFGMNGTEAQTLDIWGSPAIEVGITLPQNCSQVSIYAQGDTASMTVAAGLVWV